MSLAQVLSLYLSLNFLMVFTFVVLRFFSWFSQKNEKGLGARQELKLHYSVLIAMCLILFLQPFLPRREFFQPALKVWSGQSIRTFSEDHKIVDHGGYIALPTGIGGGKLSGDEVSFVLLSMLVMVALMGALRIGLDLRSLFRIRKKSFLIRKLGQVFIYSNEEVTVPFSYWLPFHAGVIVPSSLVHHPLDYRMTVSHELQHHRQADTRWVYAMWALRIVCAPNPFVHLWNKWLSQLQEFACDETLIDRKKVESRQYARCLVEVAQSALNQKYAPACATGLLFLIEGKLLKRRIERMFSRKQKKLAKTMSWCMGGAVVALMTVTVFASQEIVQDRRVTLADAQAMAQVSASDDGFPIVVNDLVLAQLNRYIGTPDGRDFMKAALVQLEANRVIVESKIKSDHLPIELIAIPIVESGYQNLTENGHQGVGAGIWMFLKKSARTYGLRVDDEVDQRMDKKLETDAAMRYLGSNKLLFNDWLLAVLAYNMGESHVQEAIASTGSRDAWAIVRAGYGNDPGYLAQVMAAILIWKNPQSVQ